MSAIDACGIEVMHRSFVQPIIFCVSPKRVVFKEIFSKILLPPSFLFGQISPKLFFLEGKGKKIFLRGEGHHIDHAIERRNATPEHT